jgi:hypothetical protein
MTEKSYAASAASATIASPTIDLAVRHAAVLVSHAAMAPRQEKR